MANVPFAYARTGSRVDPFVGIVVLWMPVESAWKRKKPDEAMARNANERPVHTMRLAEWMNPSSTTGTEGPTLPRASMRANRSLLNSLHTTPHSFAIGFHAT